MGSWVTDMYNLDQRIEKIENNLENEGQREKSSGTLKLKIKTANGMHYSEVKKDERVEMTPVVHEIEEDNVEKEHISMPNEEPQTTSEKALMKQADKIETASNQM